MTDNIKTCPVENCRAKGGPVNCRYHAKKLLEYADKVKQLPENERFNSIEQIKLKDYSNKIIQWYETNKKRANKKNVPAYDEGTPISSDEDVKKLKEAINNIIDNPEEYQQLTILDNTRTKTPIQTVSQHITGVTRPSKNKIIGNNDVYYYDSAFEIKGKYGKATCHARSIEKQAIEQIQDMLNMPFTKDQSIVIMPDAHAGKGCTVGTTMTITDAVCPNLVGVDINCGMLTVKLKNHDIDFEKVDKACHEVPSGFSVWNKPVTTFDFTQLSCWKELNNIDRLQCSIGTLGRGNHFFEIEQSSNGDYYLIIHSGSRNLGVQVAKYHQNRAVELHRKNIDEKQTIIEELKKQGRHQEIEQALKKVGTDTVPKDLAWLYGTATDDYLSDMLVCQEFAQTSRRVMAQEICKRAGLVPDDTFQTIHNYINVNEGMLRKGAISAKKDEKILIPLNMRDGSIIAVGKGNNAWNQSGPHGAGRLMSRSQAKKQLTMKDYQSQMEGIYTTSVCKDTLDEAPNAYKDKDDIINPIQETADIIEVMYPVYNFKAH